MEALFSTWILSVTSAFSFIFKSLHPQIFLLYFVCRHPVTNLLVRMSARYNKYRDADQYLSDLYNVGSVRREKAIGLFTKIVGNIQSNPDELKFQDLNHQKISAKFEKFQCPFMVQLLIAAGFVIDGDRLKLRSNQISEIMDKVNQKVSDEAQKLEDEKQRVIKMNQQRLMGDRDERKKKKLKQQILSQHKAQMELAKKGIYNVGASVSDRKGTGSGVNTLSHK